MSAKPTIRDLFAAKIAALSNELKETEERLKQFQSYEAQLPANYGVIAYDRITDRSAKRVFVETRILCGLKQFGPTEAQTMINAFFVHKTGGKNLEVDELLVHLSRLKDKELVTNHNVTWRLTDLGASKVYEIKPSS